MFARGGMSEVQAMPLDRLGPAAPTDDGQHVVLRAHVGGAPMALAVRQEDVFRLMALLSKAASGTVPAMDAQMGGEHAYLITAATCRSARQGDGVVLTAQIPGGMQFSFVGTRSAMMTLGAELSAIATVGHDAPHARTEGRDEAPSAVERVPRSRLAAWLRGASRAAG